MAGIPVQRTLIESFRTSAHNLMRDTEGLPNLCSLQESAKSLLTVARAGAASPILPEEVGHRHPSEFMRSTLAGQYYAVASLVAETDLYDESVAIAGFAIWTIAGALIALAILSITIYYGLEALILFIIMQGEGSATTVIVAFIVVAFIRQGSIGLGSESIMTTKIGEIVERWPSLQLYWAAHEAQR